MRHDIVGKICKLWELLNVDMWCDFSDKTFRHKKCKWWEFVNVVSCYNAKQAISHNQVVHKVYCIRLLNLEISRMSLIHLSISTH
jgi:hypothetical protein